MTDPDREIFSHSKMALRDPLNDHKDMTAPYRSTTPTATKSARR